MATISKATISKATISKANLSKERAKLPRQPVTDAETRHSLELGHNREGIARHINGRPQAAEPTYEESARFGESWATRWTGDEQTFDPRDQQARYALSIAPEGMADVPVAYARPVAAGAADPRQSSDTGLESYTPAEVRTLRQIEALFEGEQLLQGARIVVLVQMGDVRLAGRVPHEDARRRAEALARTVSGVRQVRNQLRIAIRTVPAP